MNGKQLQKMIEVAVRKEIQESLPGLIREVLTEVFLRQVVSESVSPSPALTEGRAGGPSMRGHTQPKRTREEILRMVVDDDDGPSLPPTYVSPYPDVRPANPVFSENNPLRSLYEDVDLNEDADPDDVDLSRLFDPSRVRMISEEVGRRAASNVSDPSASAARARRIAESMKVG